MSTIESVNINNNKELLSFYKNDNISDKLNKIESALKDLPTVLDLETLGKLKDGEYDITLEQYASMNSYRVQMNALYGLKSSSKLPTMLNNYLGRKSDDDMSAKDFVSNLKKLGVDTNNAVKIYGAMKSYSITTSLIADNKNSFITAKI